MVPDDDNPDMSERTVLKAGVLWIGILRKFLIPQPVTDSRPCSHSNANNEPVITTPSNTFSGAYTQPSAHGHHKLQELRDQEKLNKQEKRENKHSPIATLVFQIQEASAVLKDEVRQFSDDLSELVQDGKASTTETLYSLREGEAGRYSAVTITSLLGYMAGMRRSVAVRLVYAATGAVATATLCYPEEARYCNNVALAIIREGVRLSVKLFKNGPQKTVVIKDVDKKKILTSSDDELYPKLYSKPSQETEPTSTADNENAASQEYNVDRFEHRKKLGELSSNSEHDTLQQNRLYQDRQEMPSRGSHSQFGAHGECQQDKITRVLPYSPALPFLPEIEPDDSFQNSFTFNFADQNEPNTTPDNPFWTNLKEKDHLPPNSSNGRQKSSKLNANSKHNIRKPQDKNNTKTNDFLSTVEPVIDVVIDSSKKNNSQNYPLNKKLSRYYIEKESEKFTSPEMGYDDLNNLKDNRKNSSSS